MDLKARAIAALREQPPLDWHRWSEWYRARRKRLRREDEERRKRTRIRLTKTGWAVVGLAVLELIYILYLVHEHKAAPALRPSAVPQGSLAPGPGR